MLLKSHYCCLLEYLQFAYNLYCLIIHMSSMLIEQFNIFLEMTLNLDWLLEICLSSIKFTTVKNLNIDRNTEHDWLSSSWCFRLTCIYYMNLYRGQSLLRLNKFLVYKCTIGAKHLISTIACHIMFQTLTWTTICTTSHVIKQNYAIPDRKCIV